MIHKRTGIQIAAAALCALMGISAGVSPVMNSWAAGYEKVNGDYQLTNGTVIEEVIARGIDVSRWQGNVNWAAVAADDVSFVMLGTRSRGAVDPYFHTNVKGASAAGLKVGAYIYSLASTPEMAREEADFVLSLVKDYPISFPIAFDAEDSATLGTLPPQQVSEIINAFCQQIEDAGYYPIVYANDYWLSNKIDLSNMHYDVWVARYEAKHVYSNPIMWQVTNTGSINGISGNVDIDFLYKDLTPKLPGNMWRTIGGKTCYYQNYLIQKNAWINDGTGWFYMNSEGLATTGWHDMDGLRYYLDETTGRMHTGWKELSGKKYFFNPSGAMTTGWLDNNGARYYFNNDGSMAVGWYTDDSFKYYLSESGAVSTGWKLIDNSWYFFNQKGAMTAGWINPDGNWYYLGNDGKMLSGWYEDRGNKYYLNTSSGKMAAGWKQIDGYWYYFSGNGAMATGMIQVKGEQYYLNPADGKMAASTAFVLDGISYTADANGVCTVTGQGTGENTADSQAGQKTPVSGGSASSQPKEIGPGIR